MKLRTMNRKTVLIVCFLLYLIILSMTSQNLQAQGMEEITDYSEDLVASSQDDFVNLVLFVDFSDTVTHNHSSLDNYCFKKEGNADKTFMLFNGTDGSDVVVDKRALRPYLYNISYGAFCVENIFPQYDETTNTIHSYELSGTASYYAANPSELLSDLMDKLNADNEAKNRIGSMDLSHRENGVLDNVMIVAGCATGGTSDPFGGVTYKTGGASFTNIDGESYSVGSFNIVTESGAYLGVTGSGLLIHEFMHSIGYPDLYSNALVDGVKPIPVGAWDIMSSVSAQVQYPLAYMRQSVSGWLELPVVSTNQSGYTLTAASATNQDNKNNQAVILKTPYSDSEYFVVEYRKQNSVYSPQGGFSYDYDTKIGGSGIIIYRVNTNLHSNISGAPFMVYVFRPGDSVASNGYEAANSDTVYISDAYLSAESGRTGYGCEDISAGLSDNAITYSDGTNSGIVIKNVGSADDDTISFDISFSRTNEDNYWETVTAGRNNENSKSISSYMDTDGTLYCLQTAYDSSGGGTGFYKMKDGTWTKISEAPNHSGITPVALTKYNGSFYMAYTDGAEHVVLAQYNGNGFSTVFTSDITVTEYDMVSDDRGITLVYNGSGYRGMYAYSYSKDSASLSTISVDNGTWMANPQITLSNGNPYIVYRNASSGNTLVVKQYDNGSWKELPFAISSDVYTIKGYDKSLYLILKNAGMLELYEMDTENIGAGFIKKEDSGISDESISNLDMCISNGFPYIIYGNTNVTKAIGFIAGNWQNVGNPIATTTIDNISFFDWNGCLYVVYRENNSLQTYVKKYMIGDSGNEGEDIPDEPDNPVTPTPPVNPEIPVLEPSILSGTAHVQSFGDRKGDYDGTTLKLGTTGQGKRLESVTLNLTNNTGYAGSIRYRVHRQTYGWTDWIDAGYPAGTTGQGKRLEAIQLELTGELAKHYSIRYRVHIQTYGWNQGWQYDGALAGTAGEAKRLEALEIQLIPRTETMNVTYRVHRQTYGWEKTWSTGGVVSGTTGQSKRLEGITIALTGNQYDGGITYSTHVQSYGWMNGVSDGRMSGTYGQAKRLEGIRIQLTGEVSRYYDIYYRVHAQSYGWLSWAKNGESAGTEGLSKRLEAIQIVMVPKGGMAPSKSYGGITSVSDLSYIKR